MAFERRRLLIYLAASLLPGFGFIDSMDSFGISKRFRKTTFKLEWEVNNDG